LWPHVACGPYAGRVVLRSAIVLGGSGLVGSRLVELWASDVQIVAPRHAELDLLDGEALTSFLRHTPADVVVNLAAWADVDGAEAQRGDTNGRVYALNATYPGRLANLCAELDTHLVHVSTDYVFDGTHADRPYREDDSAGPPCWYAETKWAGEVAVRRSGARACIARIEMPFTGLPHPKRDLARTISDRLRAEQPITGVLDQNITPIFLDDAVAAFQVLAEARYTGVMHVAAADWTTPLTFAQSIARRLSLNLALIQPETFASFSLKRVATRPQHSWLDVSHFADIFGANILRPVESELDAWVEQLLTVPRPARTLRIREN
jgi:dTDP-4-dehydrorhamnose reductase